ncbi:uncharacterized protein MONBRDRAFT_13120 [Monosiga brevicollis MX1]|uniref:Uncharacterized protein n=1 Tax=Monosiga brevicollis TaxID=81824 RepID=A9VEC5_MONBE|nr:uncharacterized protein MONBRDRAFT_13120 [Monosiga brevicollis MX1]EDQ84116.1 predicted protein [Monosiga brevicollis MX1]|eukprot:XP_001751072.1 hypothetical protein [Monosiga brevicollis MX1]
MPSSTGQYGLPFVEVAQEVHLQIGSSRNGAFHLSRQCGCCPSFAPIPRLGQHNAKPPIFNASSTSSLPSPLSPAITICRLHLTHASCNDITGLYYALGSLFDDRSQLKDLWGLTHEKPQTACVSNSEK